MQSNSGTQVGPHIQEQLSRLSVDWFRCISLMENYAQAIESSVTRKMLFLLADGKISFR